MLPDIVNPDDIIFSHYEMMPLLSYLDDDKTIITKNGWLTQVIKLEGIDTSCLSQEKINQLQQIKEYFLEKLDKKFQVAFHVIRSKRKFNYDFHNYTNSNINELEQLRSKEFKETYQNFGFIVISINCNLFKYSQSEHRIFSLNLTPYWQQIKNNLEELNKKSQETKATFIEFRPTIINFENGLNSFWNYYINNFSTVDVKVKPNRIDIAEVQSDLCFDYSKGIIEVNHNDLINSGSKSYVQYLYITQLPNDTKDEIFNSLLSQDIEIALIHLVNPINKEKLVRKIKLLEAFYSLYKRHGRDAKQDLQDAANHIINEKTVLLEYSLIIKITAKNKEKLHEYLNIIQSHLSNKGVKIQVEAFHLDLAHFAMFPDYQKLYLNGRHTLYSAKSISKYMSFSSAMLGFNKCAFGNAPVALFKTTNNAIYQFNFHSSSEKEAKGHTMIFGGTGWGKTTLISYLLMKCLKFENIKILNFDSLKGLKVFTESFGGKFIDPISDQVNLNPCLLPDNHYNRFFLEEWLALLINNQISNQDKELIKGAVNDLYDLDLELRSLKTISNSFGADNTSHDNYSLSRRIGEWIPSRYNLKNNSLKQGLFSATKDDLNFNNPIVTVEMGSIVGNKSISDPLTSYLFHAFLDKVNDDSPFICFIDELHKFIDDEMFIKQIDQAAREWRKARGTIIGAIQDVEKFIDSSRGESIIKNMATYIFFPDPSAKEATYIDRLGLERAEYEWIKNSKARYQVMIKKVGGEAIIIDVSLANINNYIRLLSSSKDDRLLFESLKQQSPNFINEYLNYIN